MVLMKSKEFGTNSSIWLDVSLKEWFIIKWISFTVSVNIFFHRFFKRREIK